MNSLPVLSAYPTGSSKLGWNERRDITPVREREDVLLLVGVFIQSRSKTINTFSFTLSIKSAGKSPTLLINRLLSIARI